MFRLLAVTGVSAGSVEAVAALPIDEVIKIVIQIAIGVGALIQIFRKKKQEPKV